MASTIVLLHSPRTCIDGMMSQTATGGDGLGTLRMDKARDGHAVVIRVAGHLDLGTRGWLADFVDGALGPELWLVVDLRGVALCDAAAMSTLISIAEARRSRGGWLRLAAPGDIVARAFEVVAFGQFVPIYASVVAAVAGDETERIKN